MTYNSMAVDILKEQIKKIQEEYDNTINANKLAINSILGIEEIDKKLEYIENEHKNEEDDYAYGCLDTAEKIKRIIQRVREGKYET